MRMLLRYHFRSWFFIWVSMLVGTSYHVGWAQVEAPSATPAAIQLATSTPVSDVNDGLDTNTQPDVQGEDTTPTSTGPVFLEPVSEVNVRSSPEITEDNRIGTIRAGERYVVLGQYFNWVQFQYDLAPSNRGWVYSDLIEIIGDASTIPVIELNSEPTENPVFSAATETQQAVLEQPGGLLTITAQSRIIQLPGEGDLTPGSNSAVQSQSTLLPTFTFPPNVVAVAPTMNTASISANATRDRAISNSETRPLAPIIPIVILGSLGLLGLFASSIR